MADRKISELVEATTVGQTDFTVVVQAGETKRLLTRTLFENIKTLPSFDSEETLTVTGNISATKLFTVLEPADAAQSFTLTSPAINSCVKYVINNSLFVTSVINGATNIPIQPGNVVSFIFLKSKWWKLNG